MKAGPPFRRSAPKCSGRLPSPCFLFVDIDVVLFFSSGWSLGRVRGEGRFPQGPAPMRADDRRVDDSGRVPRPPGRSRRWAGPGPGARPDPAHGWRQNRPDPLRKARGRVILPHSGGPCRPPRAFPLAFRAFPDRTALRRSLAASPCRRAGASVMPPERAEALPFPVWPVVGRCTALRDGFPHGANQQKIGAKRPVFAAKSRSMPLFVQCGRLEPPDGWE